MAKQLRVPTALSEDWSSILGTLHKKLQAGKVHGLLWPPRKPAHTLQVHRYTHMQGKHP